MIEVLTINENFQDSTVVEMKATADLTKDVKTGGPSKHSKDEVRKYGANKEAISNRYAVMREQSRQTSNKKPEENITSAKVSLLDAGNTVSENSNVTEGPSSGLASTWQSMKTGFRSFRANIEAKRFIPLRNVEENKHLARGSSSESLDEIFQRLKRPTLDQGNYSGEDEDEDEIEIRSSAPMR